MEVTLYSSCNISREINFVNYNYKNISNFIYFFFLDV